MIQLEPVFSPAGGHHRSVIVISNPRFFSNKQNQSSNGLVGISAIRAFSGFVLRNLKVDNIAGTGFRFELASNLSIENVGIARAAVYGLWIEGGNQDSFNIYNLEVADAGVYIHNQTSYWTNIFFQSRQILLRFYW